MSGKGEITIMELKGKKILVTGGAGMIGSTLTERLIKAGATTTVVDNLWRGRLENLTNNGRFFIDLEEFFLKKDLTSYENCLEVVAGQEVVYHLADVVAGINYVFGNQFSHPPTLLSLGARLVQYP